MFCCAQAGKMSSETLHKVLREKLITTVKPGGGTLLRTYHNLHRSGNVGECFVFSAATVPVTVSLHVTTALRTALQAGKQEGGVYPRKGASDDGSSDRYARVVRRGGCSRSTWQKHGASSLRHDSGAT